MILADVLMAGLRIGANVTQNVLTAVVRGMQAVLTHHRVSDEVQLGSYALVRPLRPRCCDGQVLAAHPFVNETTE